MKFHYRNSSIEGTTLFKDWDVPNPLQWKPSLDPESNEPFMPIPFEQAIKEGLFDKNIPILTGCTSEEGLVFSTPFLKSPRRWRMLFENWYHWAPLLFFNRYPLKRTHYKRFAQKLCTAKTNHFLGEKIEKGVGQTRIRTHDLHIRRREC